MLTPLIVASIGGWRTNRFAAPPSAAAPVFIIRLNEGGGDLEERRAPTHSFRLLGSVYSHGLLRPPIMRHFTERRVVVRSVKCTSHLAPLL